MRSVLFTFGHGEVSYISRVAIVARHDVADRPRFWVWE